MTKPKLTEEDFRRAAKRLRCEVPAIKAVAQVESKGAGFYGDGFPVILFERHKFHKYAKASVKRNWKQYSDICNPEPGGYGPAGKNQRMKFNRAFELDPEAAMKSCSWGKFQIMGFNHEVCGFETVGEFVDAMKESEGRQLDAFVAFVISNKLDRHLRSKDWDSFALGYNGTNYKQNDYDTKMAFAYRKFAKEPADSAAQKSDTPLLTSDREAILPDTEPTANSSTAPPMKPKDEQGTEITAKESTSGEQTLEVTSKNEQSVTEKAVVNAPLPYQGVGFWAVVKRDLAAATGGNLSLSGLAEYAQQASGWPEWVIAIIQKLAVGVLIATIGYFVFRVIHYLVDRWQQNEKAKTEAAANTAIDRKDVTWV